MQRWQVTIQGDGTYQNPADPQAYTDVDTVDAETIQTAIALVENYMLDDARITGITNLTDTTSSEEGSTPHEPG